MKYRVIIEQDEDGVFVAEVAALPGCISQGKTRAEALNNIQEAVLKVDRGWRPQAGGWISDSTLR